MEQNLSLLWNKCVELMRDNLDKLEAFTGRKETLHSFDLTFKGVSPISLENSELKLLSPSDFQKDYIESNYAPLLKAALIKCFGKVKLFWYRPSINNNISIEEKVQSLRLSPPPIKPQMVTPKVRETINPMIAPGVKKINIESNLIPHLSFDSFVEGESNRFASTAAKSIAKRPGATAFNPLFLYGGVGVGKTHLAHATGLEIKKNFPDKVVLYISSEKFIQHFMSVVRGDRSSFHNYYQMIDVLIIDDIQFLTGKEATQESFFHIFEYLHQNGKQIILTSDRAPVDIQDIQDRIVSRFKWGLSAEIKSPDFDTRKSIIVDKLSRDGIVLTDDMLDYLAGEVSTNVRELIGVINSVIAYSTIYKSDLTLDLLKETIKKIAATQKKAITIPYIQQVVCEYFEIERNELLSKSRKRNVVLPRQLAMYFSKKYTNATFAKIGEETGGRDHSTVMYAYETIKGFSENDKEVKNYIKDIKQRIL